MDANLTTVVIAAGVSLIGITVQLYIAHHTHKSAIKLHQAKTSTEYQAQIAADFKAVEIDAERLRIRCWTVLGTLPYLHTVGHNLELLESNKKAIEKFHDQNELFLDSWSKVKHEIPEDWQKYLGTLRHDARREADTVYVNYKELLQRFAANPDISPAGNISPLFKNLTALLEKVDQFGTLIASRRREVYLLDECDHSWQERQDVKELEQKIEWHNYKICIHCNRRISLSFGDKWK